LAYACKRRIEEGQELITEGHNLHEEGERLMGLSRAFDSDLLRPAFSVGKHPITAPFWIWLLKCRQTAEMSALPSKQGRLTQCVREDG
jgi:hypothetical protein